MSRIETEIWEPVPDKPGRIQYVGQRKVSEVFQVWRIFSERKTSILMNTFH